jgi:hypothetical protein
LVNGLTEDRRREPRHQHWLVGCRALLCQIPDFDWPSRDRGAPPDDILTLVERS